MRMIKTVAFGRYRSIAGLESTTHPTRAEPTSTKHTVPCTKHTPCQAGSCSASSTRAARLGGNSSLRLALGQYFRLDARRVRLGDRLQLLFAHLLDLLGVADLRSQAGKWRGSASVARTSHVHAYAFGAPLGIASPSACSPPFCVPSLPSPPAPPARRESQLWRVLLDARWQACGSVSPSSPQ